MSIVQVLNDVHASLPLFRIPRFSAEKFLNAVLQTGSRAYDAMCRFISLHPDNRYSRVIQALNIPVANNDNPPARSGNTANNNQPRKWNNNCII